MVDAPQKRTLIREGQAGRLLMGGAWYFRLDDARTGRFQRQRSLRGWSRVSVPHNWNAKDYTLNKSSVGWYRKEFRMSRRQIRKGTSWKLRFESANHTAIVYLNGREIGRHTGGYLPWEVDAKPKRGRNRLVVRVSTLRGANDLTHWRVARFNGYGTGGWWNFGGLLREVYLRPVRGVDIEQMAVLPRMKSLRGSARVITRLQLRNMARRRQTTRVSLKLGRKTVATSRPSIAGRRRRSVRVVFTIRNPKLWQPGRPALYKLTASASNEGGRSRYGAAFGVKHLQRTASGLALLNGRVLNLRGASIHEDEINKGAAWDAGLRRAHLNYLKSLGATVTRAHYPLHPAFMEALDRAGIMFWAQAPVYQVRPEKMTGSVRKRAVQANRDTVNAGVNHASIFTWSVANEISGEFANGAYFNETQPNYQVFIDQARTAIRRLDPTRWIGIDRQSVLGQPDPAPAIRRLDVIGANEYFGWYRASEVGRPSRTADLGPFLDRTHQLTRQAAVRHRVRRGVQPQRRRERAGHLPVPEQVDGRPPAHPRLAPLRQRLDPVGAARLPRAPHLGRRQPEAQPALEQQGPDRRERRGQADLPDHPAELPRYAALPLGSGSGSAARGRLASSHAASTPPTAPKKWPCHETPTRGTRPPSSAPPRNSTTIAAIPSWVRLRLKMPRTIR